MHNPGLPTCDLSTVENCRTRVSKKVYVLEILYCRLFHDMKLDPIRKESKIELVVTEPRIFGCKAEWEIKDCHQQNRLHTTFVFVSSHCMQNVFFCCKFSLSGLKNTHKKSVCVCRTFHATSFHQILHNTVLVFSLIMQTSS